MLSSASRTMPALLNAATLTSSALRYLPASTFALISRSRAISRVGSGMARNLVSQYSTLRLAGHFSHFKSFFGSATRSLSKHRSIASSR